MDDPDRHHRAVFRSELDVEGLGPRLVPPRRDAEQQFLAGLRDDVLEGQRAHRRLLEGEAQPLGQGGVHIGDLAIGFCREEPGRRLVEIIDDVLEVSEGVFLLGTVSADVLLAPERIGFAVRHHRGDADPDPHRPVGLGAGRRGAGIEAEFFLRRPAFAGGLGQTVDVVGDIGIAGIDVLDADEAGETRCRRRA